MLKRTTFIPILVALGIATGVFGWVTEIRAQKNPLIKEGDLFPGVVLKTPDDTKDRSYLRISGKENFAIKDIKAKVILVEIMNVYCASCQNLAPLYNELFVRIQSNPDTRKEIKMIGIAAGNNDQEVKIFRDHFQVPYPIIPDPKYVMHEAIGGSPTPFSIFVRRQEKTKTVLVAGTHLGFTEHLDEEVYQKLTKLMNVDLKTIRKEGEEIKGKVLTATPIYSEEELQTRIKEAFTQTGGELAGFERISLKQGRVIYTGIIQKDGQNMRLFAEVVSQLPTCDVCHNVHFIYTFDTKGKILQFVPLQLTKYGNLDWDEADVAKIRLRIIGRYIYSPFSFDAKVDAVTSATITSAAIFKGLNKGRILFEELKKKGLI